MVLPTSLIMETSAPSSSKIEQKRCARLNTFDLVCVGLSSTLAISIFVVIGHVVRHVAGPSTILSALLAAFIAFFVGMCRLLCYLQNISFLRFPTKRVFPFRISMNNPILFELPFSGTFYAELNATVLQSLVESTKRLTNVTVTVPIESPQSESTTERNASDRNGSIDTITNTANTIDPTSNDYILSEWLLPSYVFANICHGEFAAFIIGWNLIMEFVICTALVAKALVLFIDAILFDKMSFSLQHLVPMTWPFGDYFDFIGLFVPIVIGGEFVLSL